MGLPIQKTLTIAGRVLTDLDNLIILNGHVGGSGAASSSPRLGNASSGYLPSGSNNFRIVAYRIVTSVSTSATIAYNDVDRGISSNVASVNQVYVSNSIATSELVNPGAAAGKSENDLDFLIPNGKYISLDRTGTNAEINIVIYGYEEAP